MENTMKTPPITVGDELSLSISRFGKNGDPILFYEKFVIFLQNVGRPGVDIGRLVNVKITKVTPDCGFAEIHRTHGIVHGGAK